MANVASHQSAMAQWHFRQIFGERDPSEETADEDLISAVEFNGDGSYLATGDRGGRIVIFESSEMDGVSKGNEHTRRPPRYPAGDSAAKRGAAASVEYRFYCEFQSHEPEFDYLKSLEIEERINRIRWCPGYAGSRFLLSTNDKTIKLWKIYEKTVKLVSTVSSSSAAAGGAPGIALGAGGGARELRLPRITPHDVIVTATPKRVYGNGHSYHINSIGVNCDGETFLSADDLHINLWHLHANDAAFKIVDIKPADMEELSEVITAADFHPSACNTFAYSSSKGAIRLADMRARALCDGQCKVFDEAGGGARSSFFSEVISSVSDLKFSPDGRLMLARDYMTLKLWDVAMERAPVLTLDVHDSLRSRLCELYESDLIFDKFECGWTAEGRLVTGSYHRRLHVFEADGAACTSFDIDKSAAPVVTPLRPPRKSRAAAPDGVIDPQSKILFHSHHPQLDLLAVAASNSLYVFAAS